jgi:hypothetical protein
MLLERLNPCPRPQRADMSALKPGPSPRPGFSFPHEMPLRQGFFHVG